MHSFKNGSLQNNTQLQCKRKLLRDVKISSRTRLSSPRLVGAAGPHDPAEEVGAATPRSDGTRAPRGRPPGVAGPQERPRPGLRTEVKWPRDGGSVVPASGQTAGLTGGRGPGAPSPPPALSWPLPGPGGRTQPPGDSEVLASAAAGGGPCTLPLQQAAPAPPSHIGRPRAVPLAAPGR